MPSDYRYHAVIKISLKTSDLDTEFIFKGELYSKIPNNMSLGQVLSVLCINLKLLLFEMKVCFVSISIVQIMQID